MQRLKTKIAQTCSHPDFQQDPRTGFFLLFFCTTQTTQTTTQTTVQQYQQSRCTLLSALPVLRQLIYPALLNPRQRHLFGTPCLLRSHRYKPLLNQKTAKRNASLKTLRERVVARSIHRAREAGGAKVGKVAGEGRGGREGKATGTRTMPRSRKRRAVLTTFIC